MGDLPRVLLLGDSIRLSYQEEVARLLEERAMVVGPEENCQFSAHTLANLERWLDELGTPRIVHWNNGLHDVGHNPARTPVQYSLQVYLANLEAILGALRKTGVKVIWATTTPVHPDRLFDPSSWSWRNSEIDCHNEAALSLMRAGGVPVNDLHAIVGADPDALLCDDGLHLSQEGVERCARAVATAVERLL